MFKKFLIILMFVGLSSISAIQIDEIQYQPNIIHPGDDVDLWVKITNNNYDNEVENVVVEITPHYPFELKQVNPIKGKAIISHLNPGESDTVYFKLHVDENAPSRDYRIDVKVSYDEVEKENGEKIIHHYELTKVYYLPVYGVASFQLNINDTSIIPGKTETIKLDIKNVGTGDAKYLNLYLIGNDKINILGGSSIFIGCLKAGNQYVIPIKIYATPEIEDGIYSINAKLFWIGEDGSQYNQTIPLNIRVLKKIYKNQPYIYLDDVRNKGNYVEITIGIANRGSSKLRHCVMTLTVNGKNYTRYIGDLDEDDYDTSVFDIYEFGKIPIKVRVTYFDDYHNFYNITKVFNIQVKKSEKQETLNPIYLVIGVIVIIFILYIIRRKRRNQEFEEF